MNAGGTRRESEQLVVGLRFAFEQEFSTAGAAIDRSQAGRVLSL